MNPVLGTVLLLSWVLLASAQDAKNCLTPPEYPNTSLPRKFTSRKVFSSGEKVYYNCAEDFTSVRGSRSVECRDGKWSDLTLKCEKMVCGNAGDLPNGQFRYEGETFIGEKVYVECNMGYTLKGLNYLICKRSGWAGEFPSCVAEVLVRPEEETTCSTPAVANSEQTGGVAEFREGSSVIITCKPGYILQGAQRIICGAGGQWKPRLPFCLLLQDQSLQKEGCDLPPPVRSSNARLSSRYINRKSFSSGEKVYYRCNIGYEPKGGSSTRMCNDGKWTRLKLQCDRKDCGNAGEIPNGWFDYSGSQFGDTATAVCNDGYKLVGRATRNCLADGWDGRVPVCEAVQCDEPIETSAARRNIQEPPYTYMSVIMYYCTGELLIGSKEIWCTKNGTWSAPPPECKAIRCPSPNIPNGFWVNAHKQSYFPGDTITSIECKSGFIHKGAKDITCSRAGQWQPDLPQCEIQK